MFSVTLVFLPTCSFSVSARPALERRDCTVASTAALCCTGELEPATIPTVLDRQLLEERQQADMEDHDMDSLLREARAEGHVRDEMFDMYVDTKDEEAESDEDSESDSDGSDGDDADDACNNPGCGMDAYKGATSVPGVVFLCPWCPWRSHISTLSTNTHALLSSPSAAGVRRAAATWCC